MSCDVFLAAVLQALIPKQLTPNASSCLYIEVDVLQADLPDFFSNDFETTQPSDPIVLRTEDAYHETVQERFLFSS